MSALPGMLNGMGDEPRFVYQVVRQVAVNVAAGLAGESVQRVPTYAGPSVSSIQESPISGADAFVRVLSPNDG